MLGITSTNIGFSRSASDARYAKQLNPNLSGVVNLSSGTTWNYADAGAKTAHLDSLGGTTVGKSLFGLTNPGAITFPRINADNSVTARSNTEFRTDLGLGTTDNPAFSTITVGAGSAPTPSISFTAGYGVYLYTHPTYGAGFTYTIGGSSRFLINNTSLLARSDVAILWGSGAITTNADVGIARNGAGVLAINNGTAGTFMDLKIRNLNAYGNLAPAAFTETPLDLGTVTTTATIAISAATSIKATLTASTTCAFTMPTATNGKSFTLFLHQAAATGNGAATFTGVKWSGGTAPTITVTAGRMDILSFVADGTNWYGSWIGDFTP